LSHVELLLLSQHADGELSPADARPVAEHVASCPECRAQLDRMTRLPQAAGSAAALLRTATLDDDRPAGCPSPSLLAGWGDAAVSAAERTTLDTHLASCDPCLADVLAARRLLARLDATAAVPVPDALRARVASRWTAPAAEPSALTRLVIRVTRAGAELLESHLVAPLRELAEAATPLPATRSGGAATEARSFTLHGPDATIVASIEGAGDGVGLTLRLEGDGGEPLADQRVFLRRHGRSLYSARTGPDGVLRMPGIEHGVYEVDCPGIATAFQLDLRA
jgi:anti-sigma factor RsiW